jgi:hypothetical protein
MLAGCSELEKTASEPSLDGNNEERGIFIVQMARLPGTYPPPVALLESSIHLYHDHKVTGDIFRKQSPVWIRILLAKDITMLIMSHVEGTHTF